MADSMHILMVAPEPIFEPRGTPLSVVGRCKALSDLGHRVDLLTYHIGEDVDFPRLTIHRIPPVPGIRNVKIGPSAAKVPLDFLLMCRTFGRLLCHRYDYVHTHEEAGFWGVLFAKMFRVPHLYDMHSSLPQQLGNFQFSNSRALVWIFEKLERWVLKNSAGVITICPDLHDHVAAVSPARGSVLIENVIDYGMIFGEEDRTEERKKELGLEGGSVALYTGTFEAYQGLDLLIRSIAKVIAAVPGSIFVLVGGHPDQVEMFRAMAVEEGVIDAVRFTGQVRPDEVGSYIRCADVLLSPRSRGTNTPLKIYAYFRSGVPIVATRRYTHTQVMDDTVAVLTEPDPGSFADGIVQVLQDSELAARIGTAAKALAESTYSYEVYLKKLRQALQQVSGRIR
ncbi:glycosyltransferase [bacterium]|nr:glycosyltransferase [bacterium]